MRYEIIKPTPLKKSIISGTYNLDHSQIATVFVKLAPRSARNGPANVIIDSASCWHPTPTPFPPLTGTSGRVAVSTAAALSLKTLLLYQEVKKHTTSR